MANTDDDLHTIIAEQRRELMAAQALESDLDFAYHLQMQEALTASLSLHPSTSTATTPPPIHPDEDVFLPNFAMLQTVELERFEQETEDRKHSLAEFNKIREDLHRRIHDQKVANDILRIPEDEWLDNGDYYENPYGEGSSSGNGGENFRIYFKGLMSEERVGDRNVVLAGIGVAVCDLRDNPIFELKKPSIGNATNRHVLEIKALLEGLHAALDLDLKRVTFYVDYYPLYQFCTGRWSPKQRKIATLVNQVSLVRRKFTFCNPSLVARNDVKFAFKLARDAIVSQITRPAELSGSRNLKETCVICLEDTDMGQMYSVVGCQHRYCLCCIKQHIEVKLLQGMVPTCPHEGCNFELNIDSCSKFLAPKFIEMMRHHIKEAAIPVTEKVYCPNPRCSMLMSKSEVLWYSRNAGVNGEQFGARKCMKCENIFCINCRVPWHNGMSCYQYKMSNPYPRAEDAKLKSLATMNLWRQCVKCSHMIELAQGCYHMTCRCGYQFCYTCGAEWKDKKATCSCPLWDERNILNEGDFDDDDDVDIDDDDDDDDHDDDDEEGDIFW